MLIPFKKPKLITTKQGILVYPHSFKLGDLVMYKHPYTNLIKEYGYGIIAVLNEENIEVYWVVSQKYKKFSNQSVVIHLELAK